MINVTISVSWRSGPILVIKGQFCTWRVPRAVKESKPSKEVNCGFEMISRIIKLLRLSRPYLFLFYFYFVFIFIFERKVHLQSLKVPQVCESQGAINIGKIVEALQVDDVHLLNVEVVADRDKVFKPTERDDSRILGYRKISTNGRNTLEPNQRPNIRVLRQDNIPSNLDQKIEQFLEQFLEQKNRLKKKTFRRFERPFTETTVAVLKEISKVPVTSSSCCSPSKFKPNEHLKIFGILDKSLNQN
jgi:hypothetical protein